VKEEIIFGLILGAAGIFTKSKILKFLFLSAGLFVLALNVLPQSIAGRHIAFIKAGKKTEIKSEENICS
jgi:hypothetical protein